MSPLAMRFERLSFMASCLLATGCVRGTYLIDKTTLPPSSASIADRQACFDANKVGIGMVWDQVGATRASELDILRHYADFNFYRSVDTGTKVGFAVGGWISLVLAQSALAGGAYLTKVMWGNTYGYQIVPLVVGAVVSVGLDITGLIFLDQGRREVAGDFNRSLKEELGLTPAPPGWRYRVHR